MRPVLRFRFWGCLYGGGQALLVARVSPLSRDLASQLNSLAKFIFVFARGLPALLGRISVSTTRDLALAGWRRVGNFPYKST